MSKENGVHVEKTPDGWLLVSLWCDGRLQHAEEFATLVGARRFAAELANWSGGLA